jgi:hypothetical protein
VRIVFEQAESKNRIHIAESPARYRTKRTATKRT